ncbi:hypothetical protein SGPA1_12378 [Streptomyces misionensis JCM 4497]
MPMCGQFGIRDKVGMRGEIDASLEHPAEGTRPGDQGVRQPAALAGGPRRTARRGPGRPHRLRQDVLGELPRRRTPRAQGGGRRARRGRRGQSGPARHHVGAGRTRLAADGVRARPHGTGAARLRGRRRFRRAVRPCRQGSCRPRRPTGHLSGNPGPADGRAGRRPRLLGREPGPLAGGRRSRGAVRRVAEGDRNDGRRAAGRARARDGTGRRTAGRPRNGERRMAEDPRAGPARPDHREPHEPHEPGRSRGHDGSAEPRRPRHPCRRPRPEHRARPAEFPGFRRRIARRDVACRRVPAAGADVPRRVRHRAAGDPRGLPLHRATRRRPREGRRASGADHQRQGEPAARGPLRRLGLRRQGRRDHGVQRRPGGHRPERLARRHHPGGPLQQGLRHGVGPHHERRARRQGPGHRGQGHGPADRGDHRRRRDHRVHPDDRRTRSGRGHGVRRPRLRPYGLHEVTGACGRTARTK